jgi:hypothetical protein
VERHAEFTGELVHHAEHNSVVGDKMLWKNVKKREKILLLPRYKYQETKYNK